MLKPVRWAGAFVALVCLAGSLVLTLLRALSPPGHVAVLLISFVPWAVVGYVVALVLLGVLVRRTTRRGWVLGGAALAVIGLALHAIWLAPLFVRDPVPDGERVRVMSLNLELGQGDPRAAYQVARGEHADLVVLEETTPRELSRLEAAGLGGPGTRWPHVAGEAAGAARGTVVLSRYPLADAHAVPVGNRGTHLTVRAPTSFTLTALHTTYPLQGLGGWSADLRTVAADARSTRGRHVVVGDFNATLDHRQLRRVLAAGLTDSVDAAGSGWQPTWPRPGARIVGGLHLPLRLIAIDHVLVSHGIGVDATRTHVVPGTDHVALVADLRVSG